MDKKKVSGCGLFILLAIVVWILVSVSNCTAGCGKAFGSDDAVKDYVNNECVGKPCKQVEEDFNNKGYSVKFVYANGNDATQIVHDSYNDPSLQGEQGFLVRKCNSANFKEEKVSLEFGTKKTIENDKLAIELEKTFPVTDAITQLQLYGEKQYPYGFKINVLTGKILETPIDSNTWGLKYGCEVTNVFGAKQKMNCEGKVTKNGDTYTVKDFNCY